MDKKTDLIQALEKICNETIPLGSFETPPCNYQAAIQEVNTLDELIEKFEFGNWATRTGFIYENLAFVEQAGGANEWKTFREAESGEWQAFDSISFYHMLQEKGDEYTKEFIRSLVMPSPDGIEHTPANEHLRAYVYDGAGKQTCEYVVPNDPENIAYFIMTHGDMVEFNQVVITDCFDQLVLNTYGYFIDRCTDQTLLHQIADHLIPLQLGEVELPVVSFQKIEEFYLENEKSMAQDIDEEIIF